MAATTPRASSPAIGTSDQASSPLASPRLPRVAIHFCTQCKWMLRAAYLAQELLSTFEGVLGEVALIPDSGGVFVVEAFYLTAAPFPAGEGTAQEAFSDSHLAHRVLWDRKAEGGFPETKELKRRLRDLVQPGRGLGHVDRGKKDGGGQCPSE